MDLIKEKTCTIKETIIKLLPCMIPTILTKGIVTSERTCKKNLSYRDANIPVMVG